MISSLFALFLSLAAPASLALPGEGRGAAASMSAAGGDGEVELALAGLDAEIEAAMQRLEVPGLALVVVIDGRVVLLRGWGWRDVEQRLPVTPSTIFPIGSATKPFTAFLLGTLMDSKHIDLSVPVRKVLPDFRLRDPVASEQITLEDMLSHRSGLPRHDAVWYGISGLSRAELVKRLAALEPTARFRSTFQYSNLMFVAAGHVAEVVTGKSWEALIEERVLQPLGMKRTAFSLQQSLTLGDVARPYRNRERRIEPATYRDVTLIAPAGGLWSSAEDLGHWITMLLARGTWEGRQLIEEGTLRALMRPITPTRLPVDDPAVSQPYYGLGFFVDTYDGRLRAYHGGNLDGFTSLVTLLPNEHIGIAVLANVGGSVVGEALVRTLCDRLLGRRPRDWLGRAAQAHQQVQKMRSRRKEIKASRRLGGSAPALPLERYAGRYLNPGYGELEIVASEAGLHMVYNGIRSPLAHWHFDTFVVETGDDPSFEGLELPFFLDDGPQALAVAVPFEPAASPIVFRRLDRPVADWPERGVGTFWDGELPVSVSQQEGRLWLRWPGVGEGELVPVWPGEARLVGRPDARLRFIMGPGMPVLLVFTPTRVHVARGQP